MAIKIHPDVMQGDPEWIEMRRGLLTASEMHLIITAKTLKVADNDKTRAHLYELLAQRVSGYVEPSYVSDDMLRGKEDELEACMMYAKHFHPLRNVGFITNDKWGFTIGYSPDALVAEDGLIETKSRRQKYQVQTVIENYATDTIPDEFQIQCQTGLLVSERSWLDFISYSGGLPTAPIRVLPDERIQSAIVEAATSFEAKLAEKLAIYHATVRDRKMIPTERRIIEEMF